MNITVTEQLKLLGVDEKTDACFTVLCDTFAKACDEVSVYAFKNDLMLSFLKLNDVLYNSIRTCFGLKAQLTQSVIRAVVSRYKTQKTILENEHYSFKGDDDNYYSFKKNIDWITSPIRFLRPQADLVRNRDYSFLEKGKTVSVATMDGRVKLSYSVRKDSRLFKDGWSIGGAKLVKHDTGGWYLHVSLSNETADPDTSNIKHVVGIDRGLVNIVTARDESKTIYKDGEKVRQIRNKYDRIRASLQAKGTKGAKRVLKRISGRENRWAEDVNHSVSKALVDEHPNDTLFVLEDLSGISFEEDNLNNRDADGRHELRSWSFYSLEQKLIYKAGLSGSTVIKVDPRYTSQRCPHCGNIDKTSRHRDKHKYICVKCGAEYNDDEVAGYNLRQLGLIYLSGDPDPKFSKAK